MPGQYSIEKNSERVYLCGDGYRLPAQLLRTGKFRGHGMHAASSDQGRERKACWVSKLGDSKIEQLRLPIVLHKDVAGLEIPMDHTIAMGVGHCVTHSAKEAQSLRDRQYVLLTVLVDWHALDKVHNEIWPALFGSSCVEQ